MSDSDAFANFFFAVVVLGLFLSFGSIPSTPPGTMIDPTSCYEIEGTVLHKDITEHGNRIWVELYYKEETNGYIVYVSNNTYNKYDVGYTYEEWTCDLIQYISYQDTIDELIEFGLLLPSS